MLRPRKELIDMRRPLKKIAILAGTIFLTGLLLAPSAFSAPPKASSRGAQKAVPASGTLKLGIVDLQKIMRESKAATAARNKLMKEVEGKKEQIIAKTQTVQKLEQEIAKLPATTTQDQQRQKAEQLKIEVRELNNLRQDVEEEIKRKDREMAQQIIGDIMQIIRDYARNERFSVIVERSTIIMAEESLDITDRILKLYDSQKK